MGVVASTGVGMYPTRDATAGFAMLGMRPQQRNHERVSTCSRRTGPDRRSDSLCARRGSCYPAHAAMRVRPNRWGFDPAGTPRSQSLGVMARTHGFRLCDRRYAVLAGSSSISTRTPQLPYPSHSCWGAGGFRSGAHRHPWKTPRLDRLAWRCGSRLAWILSACVHARAASATDLWSHDALAQAQRPGTHRRAPVRNLRPSIRAAADRFRNLARSPRQGW